MATRDPAAFRNALAEWFAEHGRDYPWRRTRDPYEILVSEMMLQQTRIATVLGRGYYTRFLQSFPDVRALAAADDPALLKAWEGLGYYRRARMLRESARVVLDRHDGRFPRDPAALRALPGVGDYTSAALSAFAFDQAAVLVDGNVIRVISRLMDFQEAVDTSAGRKRIDHWAAELADPERPRVYHSALMELGQTHCRPRQPDCGACPVSAFCRSRTPEALPVKDRRTTLTELHEWAVWRRDRRGRILLHHEDGPRRTGLWKLPLRDEGEVAGPPLIEHRYAITRYRVTLRVFPGGVHDGSPLRPGERWVESDSIPGLAMAAPFRKVVEGLLRGAGNRV